MPAKVNPVVPEVVNRYASKSSVTTPLLPWQQKQVAAVERYGAGHWPGYVRIRSHLTNACYNLLEKCINGITANKKCAKVTFTTLSVSLLT